LNRRRRNRSSGKTLIVLPCNRSGPGEVDGVRVDSCCRSRRLQPGLSTGIVKRLERHARAAVESHDLKGVGIDDPQVLMTSTQRPCGSSKPAIWPIGSDRCRCAIDVDKVPSRSETYRADRGCGLLNHVCARRPDECRACGEERSAQQRRASLTLRLHGIRRGRRQSGRRRGWSGSCSHRAKMESAAATQPAPRRWRTFKLAYPFYS